MSRPNFNFANQDLRNRRFSYQDLSGADFSGADLRGCNFTGANLRGANFDRALTGQTFQQLLPLLSLLVIFAIAAIEAISHMLFGVLGRTPADSGWSFVLALGISLAIAGAGSIVPRLSQPFALSLSGTTFGALLSFYYGGRAAGDNSQVAIASAVIGGVLTLLLLWRGRRSKRFRPVAVFVFAASAIAAYAFTFFAATWAFSSLSTEHFALGMIWGAVAIGSFAITLIALRRMANRFRTVGGTVFDRADLTGAIGLAVRLP